MEYKITITRSSAEKVSANYQTKDFFSSRSLELPADTDLMEQVRIGNELQAICEAEIQFSKKEYLKLKDTNNGVGLDVLADFINILNGATQMSPDEYAEINSKMSEGESKIWDACRRWFNRSPQGKELVNNKPRGEKK